MVKFVEVDPATIATQREGRRGRVSYPLIKGFMEAGIKVAKLDLTGLNKNPMYLRSVLTSYIRSHKLPIKLFSAGGDLHLMRLDMDNAGNIDPNWVAEETATEGGGQLRNMEPTPITPEEVASRFNIEKGQITK